MPFPKVRKKAVRGAHRAEPEMEPQVEKEPSVAPVTATTLDPVSRLGFHTFHTESPVSLESSGNDTLNTSRLQLLVYEI